MNILNSVIKLFVGDKQQKDLKGLQPVVEDVRKFELAISNFLTMNYVLKLSNLKRELKMPQKSLMIKYLL